MRRRAAWLLPLWLALLPLTAALGQERPERVAALPPPAAWKQHFVQDILPFWQTPAALGTPVGNFPTFRCNDGSVADPRAPCPEYLSAPEWIHGALGRRYVRMMSRQIYLYGVAFHLTGDRHYLEWAHAGVDYLLEHGFDRRTGAIVSYWQAADPEWRERTSQDLAYDLVGLSFYYYLTRDPQVLQAILQTEQNIRHDYFDRRLGLYRLALHGSEAGRLDLVAQLDQANAYMLLLTPLLPAPHQERWRGELAAIARVIRDRFYDPGSGFFVGTLAPPAAAGNCLFDRVDTDFGHTIKAYWMLHFIARVTGDASLDKFAGEHAPAILRQAYLENSGSWAMQPTCEAPSSGLNRNSKWWMAAELDQAALTFGREHPELLRYVPATFDFWRKHMVDPLYGEVWDEIRLPDYTPVLPKTHLWKNGFHTAERALVGYIATAALRAEPVVLYYALPGCRVPPGLKPYYYDAAIASHEDSATEALPGLCRVGVTFANVH